MEELNSQPAQHQDSNATTPEQHAAEKSPHRPLEVSIVSQVAPPPITNDDPHGKSKDETPTWKKVLEFGALGLAIIVALIYGGQLWVMKGQLGEMTKATKATQEAAYDACLSAKVANDTLREVRAGGVDTHNAALGSIAQAAAVTRAEAAIFRVSGPTTKFGNFITTPFSIENKGNSAAIDPRWELKMKLADRGVEPKFTYEEPISKNGVGTIPSGGDPEPFVLTFTKDRGIPYLVPGEEQERLRRGDEHLIIYGKIRYRDIFGIRHHQYFCIHASVEGDTGLYPKCAAYNSTDTTPIDLTPTVPKTLESSPINCKKPEGSN